METTNLELRDLEDWVLMGTPVDPSPTGSDFSSGFNFSRSILVFLVLKLTRMGITFQDGTIYSRKFRKKIFRKFTVSNQTIYGTDMFRLARPVPIRVVLAHPD